MTVNLIYVLLFICPSTISFSLDRVPRTRYGNAGIPGLQNQQQDEDTNLEGDTYIDLDTIESSPSSFKYGTRLTGTRPGLIEYNMEPEKRSGVGLKENVFSNEPGPESMYYYDPEKHALNQYWMSISQQLTYMLEQGYKRGNDVSDIPQGLTQGFSPMRGKRNIWRNTYTTPRLTERGLNEDYYTQNSGKNLDPNLSKISSIDWILHFLKVLRTRFHSNPINYIVDETNQHFDGGHQGGNSGYTNLVNEHQPKRSNSVYRPKGFVGVRG